MEQIRRSAGAASLAASAPFSAFVTEGLSGPLAAVRETGRIAFADLDVAFQGRLRAPQVAALLRSIEEALAAIDVLFADNAGTLLGSADGDRLQALYISLQQLSEAMESFAEELRAVRCTAVNAVPPLSEGRARMRIPGHAPETAHE